MAGSFIAIVYAKDFQKEATLKYNMNGACGNNITYTENQALYNWQKLNNQTSDSGSSLNYLNCFCL